MSELLVVRLLQIGLEGERPRIMERNSAVRKDAIGQRRQRHLGIVEGAIDPDRLTFGNRDRLVANLQRILPAKLLDSP